MNNTPETTPQDLADGLGDWIHDQLKKILETKHLYQTFQPDIKGLVNNEQLEKYAWYVEDPSSRRIFYGNTNPNPAVIWFKMPSVKLYCERCDRFEPFNPVSGENFLERGVLIPELHLIKRQVVQVFVLSFQCQSCKGVPEVFMVKRMGIKLRLCGRSEIEHVEVPKDIPKEVQQFYSGAIVAHQTGETLAGIFMLRTLLEQWARKKTSDPQSDASKVIDKYMGTLTKAFNDQFPSMRSLYGDLSTDMCMFRSKTAGCPEQTGRPTGAK